VLFFALVFAFFEVHQQTHANNSHSRSRSSRHRHNRERHFYARASVPLLFTVDKQANWIGYSLDGQDNVTITGNTTIAGLSSGLHNVTVYARDEFENMGASETISFSVAELPFPTALVAVAFIASAAAVSAVLLVYFKKRRATNLKRNNET
jgi:hypothetical protein